DRLSINVDLQPDAKVLITTASAGKIYRSNGKIAGQNTNIKIDQGAYLEFLPQENIIFNGANYEQNMRVELGEGGIWIGWEINRFGRSARGEKFTEGEWRSHTEVWQNGSPLWIDRQYLKANTEIINSYNGLGGMPIIASLVFVGKKVESDILEKARLLVVNNELEGEIGITRLQKGLLCRYRGNSSTESRHWLIKMWHLLRGNYGELKPIMPRIWPEIKGL
ncbi:MAG TPA: urease accessory protein UreD, partial [Allocoleopsis sp.]